MGVLITAVSTDGHLYGAVESLFSVAAFNFLFTEPRFTFRANDPNYPVTFLTMLSASIIASSLASRVKAQARMLHKKVITQNFSWKAAKNCSRDAPNGIASV